MKTILDVIDADQGRIAKLPAWARQHIEALVLNLTEAHRAVAELSEGPADSNVRVHNFGITPDRLLGRNTPVNFDLRTGSVVIKHDDDERLYVYCTGPGPDYYPHVLPSTSNTLLIKLGER